MIPLIRKNIRLLGIGKNLLLFIGWTNLSMHWIITLTRM